MLQYGCVDAVKFRLFSKVCQVMDVMSFCYQFFFMLESPLIIGVLTDSLNEAYYATEYGSNFIGH